MASFFDAMLKPYSMSLLTFYLWGLVWALYGAAGAAFEYVGGPEGVVLALMLLLPVPFLVWCAVTSTRNDTRRAKAEVKPLGAA